MQVRMGRLRDLFVVVTYGRDCGTFVYRVWKEGNRMSVPPDTVLATVRPTLKLRPDSQCGSDLARWLPGLVCRERKYCVEHSTGTPLSESFDACGFIGASLQREIFTKSRVRGYGRLGEMRWLKRSWTTCT